MVDESDTLYELRIFWSYFRERADGQTYWKPSELPDGKNPPIR